jgi:hypothetical protein
VKQVASRAYSSTLIMEAIYSSETSVFKICVRVEEWRSHLWKLKLDKETVCDARLWGI